MPPKQGQSQLISPVTGLKAPSLSASASRAAASPVSGTAISVGAGASALVSRMASGELSFAEAVSIADCRIEASFWALLRLLAVS